jgi:hypothetical protein
VSHLCRLDAGGAEALEWKALLTVSCLPEWAIFAINKYGVCSSVTSWRSLAYQQGGGPLHADQAQTMHLTFRWSLSLLGKEGQTNNPYGWDL